MNEYKAELESILKQIAACEDEEKIKIFLAFGEGFAAGLSLPAAG